MIVSGIGTILPETLSEIWEKVPRCLTLTKANFSGGGRLAPEMPEMPGANGIFWLGLKFSDDYLCYRWIEELVCLAFRWHLTEGRRFRSWRSHYTIYCKALYYIVYYHTTFIHQKVGRAIFKVVHTYTTIATQSKNWPWIIGAGQFVDKFILK